MKKKLNYTLIDHTADYGIEVFGKDIKSLFENAGLALFDLISDTELLEAKNEFRIQVSGSDFPDLMVNWLREILYFWTGMEMLGKDIELTEITEFNLTALVRLDNFDQERHFINHEIKAVTYHKIDVRSIPDGWKATVIFDV